MGLSTVTVFKHIHADSAVVLDDEKLRRLQLVLAGILDDIVQVCEKYDICYQLGGGSCLGALRHQGFIPWDDDIDINMSRKDYNRFVPLFRQEFGEKYWVHTPEDTDNYGLLLARVRLKGTVVKTREDFFCDECGAFVDVFIIENTFDNPILRGIQGFGSLAFGFALSCRKFWRDRKYLMELAGEDKSVRRVFRTKIALGFLTAWGSMNFWTRTANRWNAMCRNDNSRLVSGCAGRLHFWGELYERAKFLDVKQCLYEGKLRNVPLDAEGYLAHCYGDWQQIPKEQDREQHYYFEFQL